MMAIENCSDAAGGSRIRPGTGKSGGIRVIYYWLTDDDQILMLLAYPKSVRDNLSAAELSELRTLVKDL